MYRYERLNAQEKRWWAEVQSCRDSTIFQTRAWVAFVSSTQQAEPVLAAMKDGDRTVGYFTGLIMSKYGVRILGSPFPGWSTDYMGFALLPGMSRKVALQKLFEFAFDELGCAHVELMDRQVTSQDLVDLDVQRRLYQSFVIDLSQDEAALFSNLSSACRRCIRKADKNGVMIEEAQDLEFADEYFAQLKSVFAKQSLVPTYGVERVRQLITHLYPTGNLFLLRARDQQGRCIATGIFPHLNGVMYFWGGASWRHCQFLRPNEAVQWHAMKMGRKIGLRIYDMGGSGAYKRKYGGHEIQVPWIRKSRFPWIRYMRDMAQRSHQVSQQYLGHLNRLLVNKRCEGTLNS